MKKPITELSNEFSADLDGKLSALDFIKTLRACDSQIFSGWKQFSSVFDEDILDSCDFVASYCANLVSTAMTNPLAKIAIVMTGCGTSGRIAFLTARRCNRILAAAGVRPLFHYLISGGDSALLLSDELPEDDPVEGASDLNAVVKEFGRDGTFLIGVTCGLSAPYVAGQLHYALQDQTSSVGAAVMGFNPIDLSRDAIIEKSTDKWTFRDIALRLEKASQAPAAERRFAVLNPVVGPEPIAGSSRMKGGSATAVLLDAVCLRALTLAQKVSGALLIRSDDITIAQCCLAYQGVHSETYRAGSRKDALPACMRQAAQSLRAGGRVLYVGAESAGCMAFIDASEMPDTYGSPFDQMRGFVEGGWGENGVGNSTGDISHTSSLHRISYDHFRADILPTLRDTDTVVVVAHHGTLTPSTLLLAEEVKRTSQVVVLCAVNKELLSAEGEGVLSGLVSLAPEHSVVITLTQTMEGLFDYSLKLLLNAVSTYAQAAGRGAVYKGLMVTTGPANDKIYNRCVEIIAHTTRVDLARAELALMKAIHQVDVVSEELREKPRSFHIAASILPAHMRHCAQTILPVSMLLATGHWTVKEALEALRNEPRVSVLLDETVLHAATTTATTSGAGGVSVGEAGQYAVLFDLGGTNIRVATTTSTSASSSVAMNSIHTIRIGDDKSEDAVVSLIRDAYQHVLSRDGRSLLQPPACVVMAQPGRVDDRDGSISGLANFPWRVPFPMTKVLRDLSGCNDIIIVDDCDAALCGEVKLGSAVLPYASPEAVVVMVTIGTGVGTALWVNDSTYKGSRKLIEGGHMILYPGGLLCPCGQRGCVEMYCSGSAIATLAQVNGVGESAEDVVSQACRGNLSALQIISDVTKDLAVALVSMCRLYDPRVIVIGGGLGAALIDKTRVEFLQASWKLHDEAQDVRIVLASCEESGLSGCMAIAAAKHVLY